MSDLYVPGSREAEAIRQRYLAVDAATVADVLDTLGYFRTLPAAGSSQDGPIPSAARCGRMPEAGTPTR